MREFRGIRGLVIAKLMTDTAEKLEYGTPRHLAGVARLSKSTESSAEPHYYDDAPAIVVESVGADTVECDCTAFDEEVLAEITGQFYDSELGTLVEGNAETGYYAIGYITNDTNNKERYVWRHKVKASIPEEEHNTKNDSTDANGQTITFTGVNTEYKFAKTGKSGTATVYKAEKGFFTEKEFFEAVQNIDTIESKSKASV